MAKRRPNRPDPRADNRMARVGEMIRRIVAETMDELDDDRLDMVSITGVDVDRDLHRAVVWFTTLDDDEDESVAEAFEQHRGRLRRSVSDQTRLRKTPELQFRPDTALRAAERIESLFKEMDESAAATGPSGEVDGAAPPGSVAEADES